MASLSGTIWTSGSLQAFVYVPGMLVGLRQGVMYGTAIGPLAVQAFQYDYNQNFLAATLLEDSDGIVPAGSGTCDVTPTVLWSVASSGGSSGPYLYTWHLQYTNTSGAVVASGTTVNVNSARMPTLTPGVYWFTLTATNSNGGTFGLSPLVFSVLDCKFRLPTSATLIDPFDIEPVVPTEEDYIRYFPQWMNLHGTTTAPPSASSTFQFMQPLLRELRRVEAESNSFSNQVGVLSVPIGLPRKAWHLQTRFTARDVITVTCVASGETNTVRRESSLYNFLTTDDPVFIISDGGHMVLRNLARREVVVAPVSGSTGATGGLLQLLSTQYQMPAEHEGIVGDSNVLFVFNGLEYRIKAGSNGVDPNQAIVQLTTPFSGTIRFRYQSKTLAEVVTVTVSGNPATTPSKTDLWNRFDELGLVCGLQRRKDEDNLVFRKRIYSRFISSPGITEAKVAQHISQDLTLTNTVAWDGVSPLGLASSGNLGVKYFDVAGLPQVDFRSEELVRYGSNYQIYSGSKSAWRSGWKVFVNGRLATTAQYPGLSVSGNTVRFGVDVSGTVTADYAFDNYTLIKSSGNTILTVNPVENNPVSGAYTAILSKNIVLHTPSDPTYQQTSLLNPNGTPNGLFYEIATRLLEGSPLHFGRARWGLEAHWLEQTETQPLTEHLPAIFDVITGY
jgi:hypothetical protein